jgi:flagellar biosynthetic protein FlhB
VSEQAGERTEQATERRVEQYRGEGRVATSRELLAAVSLTAGALGGLAAAPLLAAGILQITRSAFAQAGRHELYAADVPTFLTATMGAVGPGMLVVIGPAAAAVVATGLGMTGFNITTEALEPKPERLDPSANFSSQFLSATPWISLLKSAGVAALVAWAVYSALSGVFAGLPVAAGWSAGHQLSMLEELARAVLERAIPVTLLVGVGDYAWQRFDLSRQMRMTRQEVREEHRDSDGDPHMKQRRRQRARQIANNRQIEDVAKADVVVVNPTHYAVALRYRKAENAAPVIVARGVDHVALRIRAAASRHDVPIIENRPLARALHAQGRVGAPVPKDLYGPVAKVLAHVYRRRRQKRD